MGERYYIGCDHNINYGRSKRCNSGHNGSDLYIIPYRVRDHEDGNS